MKRFIVGCAIVSLLALAGIYQALALDVVWDRNPDTQGQMTDTYHVYVCTPAPCTATDIGSQWVASVSQPPVGSLPFFTLPANMSGSVALTAENVAGTSGVSVSLPFTSAVVVTPKVPSAPRSLRLR